MIDMHDWTLSAVSFEWAAGVVTVTFAYHPPLIAEGVTKLTMTRLNEWGPSRSVSGADPPVAVDSRSTRLTLEMSSGDTIEIVASVFKFPTDASDA